MLGLKNFFFCHEFPVKIHPTALSSSFRLCLDKGGNLSISHRSVVGTGKNNLVCSVEYPKL